MVYVYVFLIYVLWIPAAHQINFFLKDKETWTTSHGGVVGMLSKLVL